MTTHASISSQQGLRRSDRRRAAALVLLAGVATVVAALGSRERVDLVGTPTGPLSAELAGTVAAQGVSGLLAMVAAAVLLALALPRPAGATTEIAPARARA